MALRSSSLLSPGVLSDAGWILWRRKNPATPSKIFLSICSAVSSKSREQRSQRLALLRRNRKDPELEHSARTGSLMVPLEEVQKEWRSHRGLDQLKTAADHFNLFQDVYGGRVFRPGGFMEITYDDNKTVHRGTILSPSEAAGPPRVSGLPRDKGLCSLVLSNPDGHLLDHTRELLHWMIVNIKEGEMSLGEEVVPYLQPLPPQGTGLHRMVFSLFTHHSPINITPPSMTETWLDQRTFSTPEFLSSHLDLHPFTFSLFQSQWDSSVHTTFMEHLVYPEPVYEVKRELSRRKLKKENTRLWKNNRYRIL